MFGVNNGFLDQIDDFMDLMISKVFPKLLKNQDDLEMLKTISDPKAEIHQSICTHILYNNNIKIIFIFRCSMRYSVSPASNHVSKWKTQNI